MKLAELAPLHCGAVNQATAPTWTEMATASRVSRSGDSRFSNPDHLVSTLFLHDNGRPLLSAKLWEAALRIRHVHVARIKLLGRDLSTD
ncbi:hypothetical protein SAMN05216382_0023 [Sphingomonas palmae]|uniref:Uncharacterized protein n=1 Tax=Sphingomonas palmae TaxID=1855283 RepID=A0A1H7FD39_9SPHN|nr:hypothetical protein [Sphingomonas palmae]SEK23996.1 hypothetical protein SAMN05216382_0023 [Sphingomonas palmae]